MKEGKQPQQRPAESEICRYCHTIIEGEVYYGAISGHAYCCEDCAREMADHEYNLWDRTGEREVAW